MADRIKYSFGMTVPGAEAYSSVRFDIGLESELKKGEKLEDGLTRVRELVMEKSNEEYDRIKEAVD